MVAQGAVKLDGQTLGADDLDLDPGHLDGRCCKSASASSGACGVPISRGFVAARAAGGAAAGRPGAVPPGDLSILRAAPVPCALTEAFNGYLWSAILASPVCVSLRPHAVAQVLGGVPSMGARDGL